jgi:hypothetical protein
MADEIEPRRPGPRWRGRMGAWNQWVPDSRTAIVVELGLGRRRVAESYELRMADESAAAQARGE